MRKITDISGKRFCKLIIVKYYRNGIWECLCDCGNKCYARSGDLNRGNHKSCGCYRKIFLHEKLALRPYEALYNRLKTCAERNGHSFTLNFESFIEIIDLKECHYCGSEIKWAEYSDASNQAYYLDRKDTILGYSKDNCLPCCIRCNFGKGDRFTYEEWKQIGNLIRTWK